MDEDEPVVSVMINKTEALVLARAYQIFTEKPGTRLPLDSTELAVFAVLTAKAMRETHE